MTSKLIALFFQHLPPYPIAASLRGKAFIQGLTSSSEFHECELMVFTTTSAPIEYHGVSVETLNAPEVENTKAIFLRLLGEIRIGFSAVRSIFFAKKKPNLLIVSSPSYLAALVILTFSKITRTPYVVDIRDIYPQAYAEASLISKKSIIYKLLMIFSRAVYRNSLLVLTATNGLAAEIRNAAPESIVECVYNGFPEALIDKKFVKHERFTLCFHGVFGFFQDIETLVEVAQVLEVYDIDIVVIGFGRKEKLLDRGGIKNLKFLGRLEFEETINQVAKCHVGLCLRRDEGISRDAFPVKVWECLGLGIPSIVTPHCEGGDFIERRLCGIQLNAGDVGAIVKAILMLKDNKHIYNKYVDNCIKENPLFTREQLGLIAADKIIRILRDVD